jgi:microcystin-dependent protein
MMKIAKQLVSSVAHGARRLTLTNLVGIFSVLALAYLFVPPPHQARAQFADQGTWATATSVTTGGATIVTLTLNNVSSLNDIVGVNVSFNPAANSTGPVSIIVTGPAGTTSSTALQRPSSLGLVALSLNELWAGETTSVKYNGSVFVLTSNVDMRAIGSVCEFRGNTAPRGCLIEDGSCVSATQFAALNTAIGTLYGSCSGLKLPDSRGTGFMAIDGQGANGLAGRITTASCATPNTVGAQCGNEVQMIAQSGLPNVTFSKANGNMTDFGHAHVTDKENGQIPQAGAGAGGSLVGTGNGSTNPAFTGISLALNGGVTQTGTPDLSPHLLGIRGIKY